MLLLTPLSALASPIYADGDLAPLGNPDGVINLANYTPVSSIGNWDVYEIPLPDLTGQAAELDLASVFYLGFWNARSTGEQLQFGTLYFDDIHLTGEE